MLSFHFHFMLSFHFQWTSSQKIQSKNKAFCTDVFLLICFPKNYEGRTKEVLVITMEIIVMKSEIFQLSWLEFV